MEELTRMANKKALSELQREEGLFAAHDQFQRMKKSGLDEAALHLQSEIQATNPLELAERLHDYVGADGTYMPFTRLFILLCLSRHYVISALLTLRG